MIVTRIVKFSVVLILASALSLWMSSCGRDGPSSNNPPTVDITASPKSGNAPLSVSFTLVSSDPDDDAFFCSLDFGDGSSPDGRCNGPVTHTYEKGGKFTATLSVIDLKGARTNATVEINVSGGQPEPPEENHAPTAEISADPTKGKAPLKVTFTLKSSDPDGDNVSCSLDFGDGSDASSKCSGKVEHTYEKSGDYTAKFVVKDSHGAKGEDSAKVTVEKDSGGGDGGNGEAVYVYAAGDIAYNDKNNTNDDDTAQIIIDKTKNLKGKWYALALGDLAYKKGRYDEFIDYYDPSWGKFKKNTYPVPGNHEYYTKAEGYFKYWEEVEKGRTNPNKGWYAMDLGNGWRLYAINNYWKHNKGSTQYNWLAKDLKDHPSDCILVMDHEPRYSPGAHGDNSYMDDVWDLLVKHGGDILLSGHDHLYARFKPIDENGNTGSGMVQFVVGTGGIHLYDSRGHDKAEIIDDSVYGVLELKLLKGSYAFKFYTTGGKVLDKGDRKCNASK